LPLEYEKTLNGLALILSETWVTAGKAQDAREKVLALSLAKDMRINLLTNASTLDLIQYVALLSLQIKNLKSMMM
jgi:hypothetical protein